MKYIMICDIEEFLTFGTLLLHDSSPTIFESNLDSLTLCVTADFVMPIIRN